MLAHGSDCPAEAAESEICTCGEIFRWALDVGRPRPWRPEPRDPWICLHVLDDQTPEFGR